MLIVQKPGIRSLKQYSDHLKQLPDNDKMSRFGYKVNDYGIDQLMLNIAYDHQDHELWQVVNMVGRDYDSTTDEVVGWGHMARDHGCWELAVSVNANYQRRGVGGRLIAEMLEWAKVQHISEVFMHCIEDNRVIQHLAQKHGLKTRVRSPGERTASIEVPEPSLTEVNSQRWKEHMSIMSEYTRLRQQLSDLWFKLQ